MFETINLLNKFNHFFWYFFFSQALPFLFSKPPLAFLFLF